MTNYLTAHVFDSLENGASVDAALKDWRPFSHCIVDFQLWSASTCPGVHFFAGHRLHSTALEEHLNELEVDCAHEEPAERRKYPHMSKAGAASETQEAKRSRSAAGLVQIWPFSTFLPVMKNMAVASL